MVARTNSFETKTTLNVDGKAYAYHSLPALEAKGHPAMAKLPFSLKVLLENLLRCEDGISTSPEDIQTLADWDARAPREHEIAFTVARVLLQDFTGVPAAVDLAAMRDAMVKLGGDPSKINPLQPADLVIDHSVQVDHYGSATAFQKNAQLEFERNKERYQLLKWAQQAFDGFRVVPPDTGIVHQVNLEYLAQSVFTRADKATGEVWAYPDTVVGTDSHTPMVNALGVVGWGVGGIEAEACMLGQPIAMLIPEVVGVRLTGRMAEGMTATDLVLTVVQMLRKLGVVGKFVEFFGPGLSSLPLPDRATISNMAPEYGATIGFFPVDAETLNYMRFTGRSEAQIQLVEAYCKAQGLFRTDETPDPVFTTTIELDLSTIVPSLAGPRRPQDRVPLTKSQPMWRESLKSMLTTLGKLQKDAAGNLTGDDSALFASVDIEQDRMRYSLGHGAVVLAAITSCTNTSNPSVLVAAGLVAKKAVERGIDVKPWVKTSLAPGSKVVMNYLEAAGLVPYLEALKFHLVGFGCTTCIAEGTPVLQAHGTTRRIETLPSAGGAVLMSPNAEQGLSVTLQREAMAQGERACVTLTLQDGRELVCTGDHELLTVDGRWVRADALVAGQDRIVVGLEAPLDEIDPREAIFSLQAGSWRLEMAEPHQRLRTLAFVRLLGHLLGDGSISTHGQGRIHVGQAVDRELVLNDIELLTDKRPAATAYDERKWTIVLPTELTNAFMALDGVPVGRRADQVPQMPSFLLDDLCPISVVREYLGGHFGADGHAPGLHRYGEDAQASSLTHPALSHAVRPEHVKALEGVFEKMTWLLGRCGVRTKGVTVNSYPVRRADSSYPPPQDGSERIEVRLQLADGLSFVEKVGFRYCVDKALKASAAAAYWRTLSRIDDQRRWMSTRLTQLHAEQPELSFTRARELAASELASSEPIIFPHYSLLEGHDRFSRLSSEEGRDFRPLHREACGFPSALEFFEQLGVRDWFGPLLPHEETNFAKSYCIDKEALALPTFSLGLLDRRDAGVRKVYDLAVEEHTSFVANTLSVHNCIGNSGPLPEHIANAIDEKQLICCSVLSGNRNFEGRIGPRIRANYLASPPLVVAYAIAGTMDIDVYNEPLSIDPDGKPVFLADIWPSTAEVEEAMRSSLRREMFEKEYSEVFAGDANWAGLEAPEGSTFAWDPDSTYVRHPPFFEGMPLEPSAPVDIVGARALALLGTSVTTDHISPAGNISKASPAAKYLVDHGVPREDFNSYGARRGNHEVMMRGTFANVRLRNLLAPGTEGGWSTYLPTGEVMSIYDAAMKYIADGTPLVILAGAEYGTGSSRDWAAKGTALLGVKATITEGYERIHRSNLIGMGILPLQFLDGQSAETLGLTGHETFEIKGLADLAPGRNIAVSATNASGELKTFDVRVRLDTPMEVEYYRHGGILQYVLRRLVAA